MRNIQNKTQVLQKLIIPNFPLFSHEAIRTQRPKLSRLKANFQRETSHKTTKLVKPNLPILSSHFTSTKQNPIPLNTQRYNICRDSVSLQSACEEDDEQGGIVPAIALDILVDSQPCLSWRGRKGIGVAEPKKPMSPGRGLVGEVIGGELGEGVEGEEGEEGDDMG